MPSTYEPNKKTIGDLLSMTSPNIIVPDWQRDYSWAVSNVETFWNDLLNFEERRPDANGSEYFLGSVVLVETADGRLLLLDGQQRLATSTILLSVIRDFLGRFKEQAAEQVQIRYLVDYDHAENRFMYKLRLNYYDRDFFQRLVLDRRDADYTKPTPQTASHRLIEAARDFFVSKFEEQYGALDPRSAYGWSLRVQKILVGYMTVIAVQSTDLDTAAEVFETLNDRGIGLSTPDLLRNYVIRSAGEEVLEEVVSLWQDVIEFDSDNEIRTYLRHFWVSHYGDVKTQSLYREIKSHLEADEIPSLTFSRDLSDASSVYRDLRNSRDDDPEVVKLLTDISSFGAGSNILYPALLAVVETLSGAQKAFAIRSLLHLYVRHSVILNLENSKLENVIYRAARELRADRSLHAFCEALREAAPGDEALVSSFANMSVTNTAQRRYLLYNLEMRKRTTEELEVAPPNKVHVEHIYPQTPREGERWENHSRLVNRLGNLTLLSSKLNSAIKNGNFGEKRQRYNESDLVLTREVSAYEQWTENEVSARQQALADLAPAIWEMPQAPDEPGQADPEGA